MRPKKYPYSGKKQETPSHYAYLSWYLPDCRRVNSTKDAFL